MNAIIHPQNWFAGWTLILAGFAVGAGVGLFFHRETFLGGYSSFPRRMIRLGHIALIALGGMNVLFSLAVPGTACARGASMLLITGAALMPAICFATAWRASFRNLFFIPVLCLVCAVAFILMGGLS